MISDKKIFLNVYVNYTYGLIECDQVGPKRQGLHDLCRKLPQNGDFNVVDFFFVAPILCWC